LGQIEQNPAKAGQSQSKDKLGIMAQTPQEIKAAPPMF
jgi:hypothetical protein